MALPHDDIFAITATSEERRVANLLVRGVDDDLVRALKERAVAHGHSAEAEHRAILAATLRRPKKRSLAQVLASMPAAGDDADFERVRGTTKARRVLD
jgi:plasmid stability protein